MKIIQGAIESSAKRGGGKLNRSETVTVRLDPKLNYLCELAARLQRRTKSSFIEWAVAESLSGIPLPDVWNQADWDSREPASLQDKAVELWHVDEADRVVSLALTAPLLLSHDEQLIWKHVKENGYVWKGRYKNNEWEWDLNEGSLIRDRLRKHWEHFKDVALGDRPLSDLPSWSKTEVPDYDEEVPF
jgi:hypothetical protein